MASVPEFSSGYSFSHGFSHFQNPLLFPQENCIAIPTSATSGEEIRFPMFFDDGGVDVFQQDPNNLTSSVPTAVLPDNNAAVVCGGGGRYQLQDVCGEFAEECKRILHQDFKPVEPNMGENWGVQGNPMVPATQDNMHKAVRYSVEERKDRILRYLKKRNRRNFNKTIKYACRKTLADRRVRVRGRFARNDTELCEDEMVMKKKDDNNSEAVQIKHDDLDDWLQEATANLIYSPHVAG